VAAGHSCPHFTCTTLHEEEEAPLHAQLPPATSAGTPNIPSHMAAHKPPVPLYLSCGQTEGVGKEVTALLCLTRAARAAAPSAPASTYHPAWGWKVGRRWEDWRQRSTSGETRRASLPAAPSPPSTRPALPPALPSIPLLRARQTPSMARATSPAARAARYLPAGMPVGNYYIP